MAAAKETMVQREGAMPDRSPPVQSEKLSREDQKKKDQQKVTAIFRWYENPGGSIAFCYRRYKDEPILTQTYTDNQKYEIPFGMVRHINEDCAYPEHTHLMDAYGNPIVSKRKGYQRMEFIPAW